MPPMPPVAAPAPPIAEPASAVAAAATAAHADDRGVGDRRGGCEGRRVDTAKLRRPHRRHRGGLRQARPAGRCSGGRRHRHGAAAASGEVTLGSAARRRWCGQHAARSAAAARARRRLSASAPSAVATAGRREGAAHRRGLRRGSRERRSKAPAAARGLPSGEPGRVLRGREVVAEAEVHLGEIDLRRCSIGLRNAPSPRPRAIGLIAMREGALLVRAGERAARDVRLGRPADFKRLGPARATRRGRARHRQSCPWRAVGSKPPEPAGGMTFGLPRSS